MWQKERLLNAAIRRLPRDVTKVVWVDGDVLFANPAWIVEMSRLLDNCMAVQPFKHVIRLPRGMASYRGEGDRWKSFAAVYKRNPRERVKGNFHHHGHTGFAWAARRDLLERHGHSSSPVGEHRHVHVRSDAAVERLDYARAAREFLATLQNDVARRDRTAVCATVKYPLRATRLRELDNRRRDVVLTGLASC